MAIKDNLCRQLLQFKNMDVRIFTNTSIPLYINMFPGQLEHERVAENTIVVVKAECLAYFEGGSRPGGGSFSSPKRKGLEERTQLGDRERAKSDPPCIIPFERHFKNGLSVARLLTSGVDA